MDFCKEGYVDAALGGIGAEKVNAKRRVKTAFCVAEC